MEERYCLIFQYDDSNCTRVAYIFDTYGDAHKALLDEFRVDNETDEEVMEFLETIENRDGSWSDDGKVWELIPVNTYTFQKN